MCRSSVHIGFRTKLLLALLGTIAPLLIIALLVVRRETGRQVDTFVGDAVARSQEAFARIERLRQLQLQQLGERFAFSNRISAALSEALAGDTTFLIESARYELGLAGLPNSLAVFTDLESHAVAALADDRPMDDPAAAVPRRLIDRILAGDSVAFDYHAVAGRLFSVHPVPLQVVVEPVGFLTLGSAIDDSTAALLGQALGDAEVCFVAGGRCAGSTRNAKQAEFERRMIAAAPSDGTRRVSLAGEPYAIVARQLGDSGSAIVLALPLASVLRSFATIQQAIRVTGILALLAAIVIALALSRGLARPVRALVAATERVAQGDYDASVPVTSRDELGTLARAFNQMTHGLRLKEKYRGVLDKVVSRDIAEEMLRGEIVLGGENREVTALFADLRGFTSMVEHMQPQAVIALLNEVMERCEAAVVAEGGVVDKYVGDQVMAIFGAPISYPDDAQRAVRAASRMVAAIAELSRERETNGQPPVALGVGVHTGVAVAGNMGSPRRLNYTIVGGSVNLASRLCGDAGPSEILISAATYERVREAVDAVRLAARTLKGISQPVTVYGIRIVRPGSVAPA